jgi:hypothetical protein
VDWFTFLRRIVSGTQPLVGDVLPARAPPPVPQFDGRTAALRALKEYVCALQFYRPGDNPIGRPIPFTVDPRNFHIDIPDYEYATDFAAGTCAVVPTGRYTYDETGLSTFFDEASWNAIQPATVLQVMSTYTERFDLDYRCALKQQRRAFKAGLEVAFSPVENVAVLRLNTRGYFGQTAEFSLLDGALTDTADEGMRRRSVKSGVQLSIQVVRLVSTVTFKPVPLLNVDVDQATGTPVATTTNLPPGS